MRAQSCNTVDSSLPGSSVHGLFQARILEWVALSFSINLKFKWTKMKENLKSCHLESARQPHVAGATTWDSRDSRWWLSVVLRPAASVSPGRLLEMCLGSAAEAVMQNLHSRTTPRSVSKHISLGSSVKGINSKLLIWFSRPLPPFLLLSPHPSSSTPQQALPHQALPPIKSLEETVDTGPTPWLQSCKTPWVRSSQLSCIQIPDPMKQWDNEWLLFGAVKFRVPWYADNEYSRQYEGPCLLLQPHYPQLLSCAPALTSFPIS